MKPIRILTLAVIATVMATTHIKAATTFGNTLFIGDSITEASSDVPASQADGGYSWRYSFWQNLVDNGDTYNFVGSRTSNQGGDTTYPTYAGQTFVNRHEAIWGTTALERRNTLAGQYTTYNADTAFILLGTNDIFNGTAPATARNYINAIVDGLQAANASVNINIISVPPRFVANDPDGIRDDPMTRHANYTQLNTLLQQLAVDEGANVNYIDITNSISHTNLYDGTHPNASGEELIGNAVYNAVTVPEPSSTLLVGLSAFAFTIRRKR